MYPSSHYKQNGSQIMASGSRQGSKKPRTELACDFCRQRKIRCEGSIDDGKCTNCAASDLNCVYTKRKVSILL
ncbi:hypothetical protein PLICRDRAFT_374373 [Plicaturopsis crispa FD-325 SS-3]|uniref:Zn(2)-C6 fungal-type domain-containing protein n=1 Tax=Plicaturopsis crispa FD-325 SS-3 TaxID=944288 RepID=A0A0C9SKR6_PLICR|nr:hypothetical protein PLICRDRAFT_374373 [Plicaturopsis crispa FD-325 SS-3]